MTYKLFTRSQQVQVLVRTNGIESVEVGHVLNGTKGWQAYHVEPTDRMSSMGRIYQPVGEPVGVSRMVNQHDGADQIATALGL